MWLHYLHLHHLVFIYLRHQSARSHANITICVTTVCYLLLVVPGYCCSHNFIFNVLLKWIFPHWDDLVVL